eukprot:1373854-Prymnesium_polylepis.2
MHTRAHELRSLFQGRHAPVERESQLREVCQQLEDPVVPQRRHGAVLGGVEVQDGLSSVDDEMSDSCRGDRLDELLEICVAVALVHAEPALDCHRHGPIADGRLDRDTAGGDSLGVEHESGTVAVARAATRLRRTAAVEVDLVIPARNRMERRSAEHLGIGAT